MKYTKVKNKNRLGFFAIVYSLVIMLAVLQIGSLVFGGSAVVAVDEWNITTKPLTGISIVENSSSKTTMLVSTPSALDYALYYASNPISNVDLTIELVNSIDMSAKYIKPKNITNSKLIKLTIIGHGNTISGLKYSTAVENRVGLISYIKRPLHVEGVNLRFYSHTLSTQNNAFGALIGVTECNDITITKCAVYGTITVNNCTYGVGGLIGYTNSAISSINNCWSYCTITSGKQDCYVGGLAGYLTCGSVYNCANFEGTIKSTAKAGVGGLFGYAGGASTYSKCFNQAKVESNGGPVGGLIGKLNTSNVQVNDCYNNADLSCNNGSVIGGIVGSSASGLTFNRCYSNGVLTYKIENLKKDESYSNTFATYEYEREDNSFYYPSGCFATINYNGVDIQNDSGGGGTSKPKVSFIAKNMYTGKSSFSSLCSTTASYNNSYFVSSISGSNLLQFDICFSSTSGNSGVECSASVTSNGQLVLSGPNDVPKASTNDIGINTKIVIEDDWDKHYGEEREYIGGINFELTEESDKYIVKFTPIKLFYLRGYGKSYDTSQSSSISITKTNSDSPYRLNSASDLNSKDFGPAFTTASGRNGDLPILKDFYWEYNS